MVGAAKSSAAKEPIYLIVVTLRDGRNFPYNAHEQIIAEAKFGTNTLTTDPKKYEVTPHFDEELCWSTSPRALHDHKLRRTPIKITAYGWDARTAKRQQIGYITLDIRTYLTRDRFEWHSLVGVPYMRERPELQLSIKCEEDDVKPSSGIVASSNAHTDASPATSSPSPPASNSKLFSKVHVSQLPSTSMNTSIPPPLGLPSLTVASSSSSVVSKASSKQQRIHGTASLANDRSQMVAVPTSHTKKDIIRSSSHASSLSSLVRRKEGSNSSDSVAGSATNSRPPSSSGTFERRSKSGTVRSNSRVGTNGRPDVYATSADPANAKQLYAANQLPATASEDAALAAATADRSDLRPRFHNTDNNYSSHQAHHFCCTINLFSIALTSPQVRKSMSLYARYTYSFFGTSSPIITRPSVEVPPRSEKRFNNGYCSFSFACASAQMHRAFECVPLTVEIYSTTTATRDSCIGVTKIPLATLLQQPKNQTFFNDSEQGIVFRQQLEGIADVVDVVNEQTQQPLGRLHYKLCMDDYGVLQDSGVVLPPSVDAEMLRSNNHGTTTGNSNLASTFDDLDHTLVGDFRESSPADRHSQHQQQLMPAMSDHFRRNIMPHAPITNGYDPLPAASQSSAAIDRMPGEPSQAQQHRYNNHSRSNSSDMVMAAQPPPTTTNVYTQAAARFIDGKLHANVNSFQEHLESTVHNYNYASSAGANNRSAAAGDKAADRLTADPPPFATSRAHTPPTRNELGRTNPGGAGSNVTEHENLLVNELMKLRLQKMEMQAAMELEVWKEEEERKFSNYLKQKEQESLKILADEWRRRDKEREHLFDERRSAYEEQEAKLRNALDTVSARERQLADVEKELAFREEKLLNERSALDAYQREVEERISKTFEGKLENEKIITENLRRLLKENEERLVKVEKRVGEKEQECADLRDKLAERPEHQLRSQMEILKVEKRELEARVKEAMEQANHFKSQWSKAMADLHRVRGEERQSYDGRMKALSREVEQLKMALTKETRTMMSKKAANAVDENTAGSSANHQQNFDHNDDAGRHETTASAGEHRPSARQQEEYYAASIGGRSAGTSSAYEESDAESVLAHDFRPPSQRQPPGTVRRKLQQRSDVKKYSADETDDEEMRARKQELLKLMDERNVLLKTGIYSPDDEMIRDLNKKIRELEVQLIDDGVSIPDA